jgi:hypothetical protein
MYFTQIQILGYETNPAFMGAICGRVANRIDGATFELDGTKYDVSKNDPLGNNMCHGGFTGLTRVCEIYLHDFISLLVFLLVYTPVLKQKNILDISISAADQPNWLSWITYP